MRYRRRCWLEGGRVAMLALALVGLLAARAEAQPDDPTGRQVEKLAAEAATAYRGADYQRAVDLWERAYQTQPIAGLLYNLAKAYEKLGAQDKAIEEYRRYSDASDADPKLRVKAEARIAAYEEAHRKKDPGAHDPSPRPHDDRPLLGQVDFNLKNAPPETPAERASRAWTHRRRRDRAIGITLASLGVVSLAAAIGLSASATVLHNSYTNTLDTEDAKRAERTRAKAEALGGDVLYGVAAAAAGVGAYFLWRGYHHERTPSAWLTPAFSPHATGLVLGGSF